MTLLPVLAAALLAADPAPRLAGGFECPAAGGPAWYEVQTAHFSVVTDLSPGKAGDLAREVERIYEVVLRALFKTPPAFPGRVRVVALRSEEGFGLFAAEKADAFYLRSTLAGPAIVVPGTLDEAQRIVIAHELTHHVAARVFQRQPRWFSEGLACYMESVGTSGPGNAPTVGGAVKHRLYSIYPWHGGLAALFNDASGQWDYKEYGLAWALVHYLKNAQPAGFADLQGRFVRGQDPDAAWREVFPQWDPARPGGLKALEDTVGQYVAYGKFGYRDVKLPEEREATARRVGAAEAHAVRLSLPWLNRGKPLPPGVLEAEVAEALGHDPGHVTALRVRAVLEKDAAARLALAEKAVAAHPEDGRAWDFLASTLPDGDARRGDAFRKAAELMPEDGTALNNHAWHLLQAGRSGEALPLARAAVTLEPWNPLNLDTLAAVLDDLGQCPAALPVQRRACDLVGEGFAEALRKELKGRLAALEKECGPKPAAPAPASP